MINPLSGMLIALLCCSGVLHAQLCSSGIESPDCYASPTCVGAVLSCEVEKRYSLDIVPWVSPEPFDATTPAFGSSNCDPTFYFDIKRADDDFANTLNSERANWNQAGTAAFFKGPNARALRFFDDSGNRKGFQTFVSKSFFSGPNPSVFPYLSDNQVKRLVSSIRWHPTDDAIFYPRQVIDAVGNVRGSELVKQTVDINNISNPLGTPQLLYTFNGYTISSAADNFVIAGGDGNDVQAGRFLLSFKPTGNPTANNQYAVYDFNQDKVVKANIGYVLQTYSETYLTGANFKRWCRNPSPCCSGGDFSYLRVVPQPLHSGGKFRLEVDSDSPDVPQAHLRLTSLDGRVIQVWSGPVGPADRIQAVLPNLAAGIYVAELVHAESGAKLMQQKVLVR